MKYNPHHPILENLSVAFLAQAVSLSLSVLMSILLPKILLESEFAYWQLFLFYGSYVGLFHFGLSDGIYLRYGGARYADLDKPLLGAQMRIMLLLQVGIASCVLALSHFFVAAVGRKFTLLFAAIYLPIANVIWFFGYVFQAVGHTKWYSYSIILAKTACIGFISALLAGNVTISRPYILLYLAAHALAVIYCLRKGRHIAFSRPAPPRDGLIAFGENAKVGAVLTLANVAGTLILGIGRFVIDFRWGLVQFGRVSFCITLTTFFLQFINQVSMVLFPALRRSQPGELRAVYLDLSRIVSLLLPALFVLYIPIRRLMGWWLPQYLDSLRYLGILLPISVYDGKMNLLCATYFKVLRRERLLLQINLFVLVLSLILCLLGAYGLQSVESVLFFLMVAVVLRSIFAERKLSRILGVNARWENLSVHFLAGMFLLSARSLGDFAAFLLVGVAYLLYLWGNRRVLMELAGKVKRLRGGGG